MDPLTVGLIVSTCVGAVGTLFAVLHKHVRALNCFGKSCIQFRSTPREGSPDLNHAQPPTPPQPPQSPSGSLPQHSPNYEAGHIIFPEPRQPSIHISNV